MKITAYKAFNSDWTCNGFQFKIGREYTGGAREITPQANVEIDSWKGSGFEAYKHLAASIVDFNPKTSVFAEVELLGDVSLYGDKYLAKGIRIVKQVDFFEIAESQSDNIKFCFKKGDREISSSSCGYSATLGTNCISYTTGKYCHSAENGAASYSLTLGDYAHSFSFGYNGISRTVGKQSHSVGFGTNTWTCTYGDSSHSILLEEGYQGSDRGMPHTLSAHSTTYGDQSFSVSLNSKTLVEALGPNSAAIGLRRDTCVKAAKGNMIALCHYRDAKPVKIVSGVIGKRGLKPDTWYTLDSWGRFVKFQLCDPFS